MIKIKKILSGLILTFALILNFVVVAQAAWYDNDSSTTFTEFNGEFQPPDKKLYPDELTQATNVRDFIVKVLNFGLGFLGLIAIAAIIYGGFLYVTAGGEPERADKGKKNVSYSIIGIIIILSSYAIVNTVIKAPSGQAPSAQDSNAGDDGQGTEIPQVNALAATITTLGEDISGNFTHYTQLQQDIDSINNVISQLSDYVSNPANTDEQKNQASLKALGDIKDNLKRIEQFSPDLTQAKQYSQAAINYIDAVVSKTNTLSQLWQKTIKSFINSAKANINQIALINVDTDRIDTDRIDTNDINFDSESYENCTSADNVTQPAAVFQGSPPPIQCYIDNLKKAGRQDYNQVLSGIITNLEELEDSLGSQASNEVTIAFDNAKTAIERIKIAQTTFDAPSNNQVKVAIDALETLKASVSDLKFFFAKITASAKEGNAPLSVRLDGLKSIDPLKRPIVDSQYNWTLPTDPAKARCTANQKPVVNCVFLVAGTYQIKLEVDDAPGVSADQDIGQGIAYAKVTVSPSKSKLILDVFTKSNQKTPLADYTVTPQYSKVDYNVTVTEAAQGLKFDACQSTDGDDQPLSYYGWDYGDNTNPETNLKSGPDSCQKTHYYTEKGSYKLNFEVTDDQGTKDQALVTVNVTDIAARIDPEPGNGSINTIFTLDGSNSSTVNGSIQAYDWKFTKNNQPAETNVEFQSATTNTSDSIKIKFTEPGDYKVMLSVTDSTGAEASDYILVKVASKPPVVKYTYTNTDPAHPGVYQFDGSKTYDVDGDALQYTWLVVDPPCDTCFESGADAKVKTEISFPAIGQYKVKLLADDGQTTGTYEEIINVSKVLSADLNVSPAVAQLQNGQAVVTFSAISNQPATFSLDTGDSLSETGQSQTASTPVLLPHTYKKAGLFTARLTVINQAGVQNTITATVLIGDGTSPLALFNVYADGQQISDFNSTNFYKNTVITFDASPSINAKGSADNLNYKWQFPSQFYFEKPLDYTGQKVIYVHKTYDGQAITYPVSLKVVDKNTNLESAISSISNLKFTAAKPSLRALTAFIKGDKNTTPLDVEVSALDAKDPDGLIREYVFWYQSSAGKVGPVQITTQPKTVLTINSEGVEGETSDYSFFVKLIDSDNSVYDLSQEDFNRAPTVTVTYGPNKPPVAKISVAGSTTVEKNTPIRFICDCKDPEGGDIVSYNWDLDGDQNWNNNGQYGSQATAEGTYSIAKKGNQPYQIRVMVKDSQGSLTISDPVPIYVESQSTPPTAQFNATVTDLNTRDVQLNLAGSQINVVDISAGDPQACPAKEEICPRYVWDFDANDNDDDDLVTVIKNLSALVPESFTINSLKPGFYKQNKRYKIRLTVLDSEGTPDTYEQTIDLSKPNNPLPQADFTYSLVSQTATEVTVQFNASTSKSFDADKTINNYSYECDLSVDANSDGNSRNDYLPASPRAIQNCPPYKYGRHTVALKVTDDNGEQTLIKDITLTAPDSKPPVADFTYSLSSGQIYVNAQNSQSFNGALSYVWDFDSEEDVNNDGDPTSDRQATGVTASYQYQTAKNYKVKLVVTDSTNLSTSRVKSVSVLPFGPEPEPLSAKLLSLSQADYPDGKIHLSPDTQGNAYITFDAGGSTGPIKEYYLDKNIYFDTDGDGKKGNDLDLTDTNFSPDGKIWEGVLYSKSWLANSGGKVAARLMILSQTGTTDVVDREIVFDTPPPLGQPTAAFTSKITTIQTQSDGSLNATVTFSNNSLAASGTTLDDTKYQWDFDSRTDSNGDGETGNDTDSREKSPTFVYHYYGNYNVKLTVCDKQSPAACDSALNTIKITDLSEGAYEEIDAKLWSTPEPSYSDGKIHLKGDKAKVVFDFRGSVGNTLNYFGFDRNINFDSDGNGRTDDDYQPVFTTRGTFETEYEKAWGEVKPVIVKLLVKNQYGQQDSVTREIVFDSELQANILNSFDPRLALLLASSLIIAIVFSKVQSKFRNRR